MLKYTLNLYKSGDVGGALDLHGAWWTTILMKWRMSISCCTSTLQLIQLESHITRILSPGMLNNQGFGSVSFYPDPFEREFEMAMQYTLSTTCLMIRLRNYGVILSKLNT
jgi:hypothetical protein